LLKKMVILGKKGQNNHFMKRIVQPASVCVIKKRGTSGTRGGETYRWVLWGGKSKLGSWGASSFAKKAALQKAEGKRVKNINSDGGAGALIHTLETTGRGGAQRTKGNRKGRLKTKGS